MKRIFQRDVLVLALVALVLFIPVVVAAIYVIHKHGWAQSRLAELEPRYARMAGLLAQEGEISELLKKTLEARQQFVYSSAQDETLAANSAQQKIREIFSNAGVQVVSSQVLPSKDEKGFDRIPLVVRTESDWLSMQTALTVISSQKPLIIINEMETSIQGGLPATSGTAPPKLITQFNLSVLRERS